MTNLRQTSSILAAFALAIAACGGGNNSSPDAAPSPDSAPPAPDARVCGSVTAGTLAFDPTNSDGNNGFLSWTAPVTGDNGDTGDTITYRLELYDGIETNLAGTFDLSAGNQADYATCALCVRAFVDDASGNPVRQYFQSGGSITLTEDPFTHWHAVGSVSNLQMQEVTIDSSFHSTPVAGGKCANVADQTMAADAVPADWTCTHDQYKDNTTCDCACGDIDPDCATPANPVAGCTPSTDTCYSGTCQTVAANDTCTTAIALDTVNATPTTGQDSRGGHDDYDAGLDGASCTNLPEPGPDVAYSAVLTAATAYTFTLSSVDAGYSASIALVGNGSLDPTVCSANPITTCVAGAVSASAGSNVSFTYTPTTGGTFTVTVTHT